MIFRSKAPLRIGLAGGGTDVSPYSELYGGAILNATLSIYTHPLGVHGHAAGPTIGMWDQQGGVPGAGDFPLNYRTAYAIELNAASEIPEWKKTIRIMLEEDGYFDESGFRYIGGRQKEIYIIPRKKSAIGH